MATARRLPRHAFDSLGVCRICRASGESGGVRGRLGLGQKASPGKAARFVALDAAQVTLCVGESETVHGLGPTSIGSHVHRPALYRFNVLGGTRGPAS